MGSVSSSAQRPGRSPLLRSRPMSSSTQRTEHEDSATKGLKQILTMKTPFTVKSPFLCADAPASPEGDTIAYASYSFLFALLLSSTPWCTMNCIRARFFSYHFYRHLKHPPGQDDGARTVYSFRGQMLRSKDPLALWHVLAGSRHLERGHPLQQRIIRAHPRERDHRPASAPCDQGNHHDPRTR